MRAITCEEFEKPRYISQSAGGPEKREHSCPDDAVPLHFQREKPTNQNAAAELHRADQQPESVRLVEQIEACPARGEDCQTTQKNRNPHGGDAGTLDLGSKGGIFSRLHPRFTIAPPPQYLQP